MNQREPWPVRTKTASPGRDRRLRHLLALEAGLEVGQLDLLAHVEHPALQALDVEQHAAGEEGRRLLHAELLQAIGRPHVGQPVAVVEEHLGLVALLPALAAEMAEGIHLRPDLADLGG